MDTYKVCKTHGETRHYIEAKTKSLRCRKCASDRVSKTRKKNRALLVEEAGGKCSVCSYDRCHWALHFHHVDPTTKEFSLAGARQTASLTKLRAEAAKCILLCANCHAEVESGFLNLENRVRFPAP